MKLGDFNEDQSRIVPNPDGTGNNVFLSSLPYYEEGTGKKLSGIVFPFVDEQESIYLHNQIDPELARTQEEMIKSYGRLKHFYGALMSKEVYDKANKELEFEDVHEFVEKMNELVDENIFEIPLKLLVAYNKSGFLSVAPYGDAISSKFKPKTLQWTPKSKTTLKPKVVRGDSEDGENDDNDM
jgi:hypothetical protein